MYIFKLNTIYKKFVLIYVILERFNFHSLSYRKKNNSSIINLFTITLIFGLLTVSSKAKAQELTINVKNESFITVLTDIKKQTGYDYVITSEAPVKSIKITLQVKKEKLALVLQKICKDNALAFSIKNKTIFISDKKDLKTNLNQIQDLTDSQEQLSGRVLNKNGDVLSGASLYILDDKEEIIYKQIVSDENGVFELPKEYKGMPLLVTFIGYTPQKIVAKSTIGDIKLDFIPLDVDEITVTGQKALIKRTLDKLILNIDGTIYEKGENALVLLNALPSINVLGKDIIFRGAERVTIYIDNKKLMIPQEQLTAYLQGIPSESILSYQLKIVPGAENDAQNAGTIINILLKSEYKFGLTGNINSGYWNNGENNMNVGSFLNYRTGKTTFQGMFNYRNSPAFYEDHILQNFNVTDLQVEQQEKYLEKLNTYSVTFGLDHKINKNQTIGFNYNIFTNPRDFSNSTKTHTIFRNVQSSSIDSSSFGLKKDHYRYVSQMANVFYRHKIDTTGSVLDLGYSLVNYSYNNPTDLETTLFDANGKPLSGRDSIYTYNDGSSLAHVFNADLEKNFNNNWSASIGTKYISSKTDYIMEYRKGLDRNAPLDILRSDAFAYNENILAFYSTVNHKLNSWQFKLGLRTERTQYDGTSRLTGQEIAKVRWDLFPSAYINKKIAENHGLTLSYGRRIERPGFKQLNPFTYYTNINNIQEGNSFLRPYFSNNFQLEYLLKNKYSFTVGYQNTVNSIATTLTNINDVTIFRDENISDYNNIFLSIYVPIKITKWWDLNINSTLRNTTAEIRSTPYLHRSKFSQHIFVMNRFTLPNKLFIEISGFYNRNTFYDYFDSKNVGKMDISARKTFLGDKLTARLEVCDPFHFYKPGQRYTTDNFTRFVNRQKIDFARYIGLWVTYNFSAGKKATNREQIDIGGNDVRRRL